MKWHQRKRSRSRLGTGSYPAGRDPLRLVLRPAHRRQQLDARVLQLVVDNHVVEELPVLRLHLPGCFLHLLEVFVLAEERESQTQKKFVCDFNEMACVFLRNLDSRRFYFEGSVDVVVGGDRGVLSGLPEALQWRRLHVDDVGLQLVGPHGLDGLNRESEQQWRKVWKASISGIVQDLEARPCRSYVWLYVDHTDLSGVWNFPHGLDAGAVQIPSVLPVFKKPADRIVAIKGTFQSTNKQKTLSRINNIGENEVRTCCCTSCCRKSLGWWSDILCLTPRTLWGFS